MTQNGRAIMQIENSVIFWKKTNKSINHYCTFWKYW